MNFSNAFRSYVSTVNSSTTNLGAGNSYTFTGTAERTDHPDLMINLYADQDTTISIQFSQDGTNWDSTLSKKGVAGFNEFCTAVKGNRYVRIVVTTASLTTTVFRLQTQYGQFRQGNLPLNATVGQDSDCLVVRAIDSEIDISNGKYTGYSIVNKFGKNPDVDTATVPEDIWDGGGAYTGWASSAETVQVLSSSVNDTSAGTGARTIRIMGLDSNYIQQEETLTLNGTTVVNSSLTFIHVHSCSIQTAGSGGSNAGTITVRQTTTTANVFAVMQIGTNQTHSSAYIIPSGYTGYMRKLHGTIRGAASSSVDGVIYVRNFGGVFRQRRPFALSFGTRMDDVIFGGLSFSEKTAIILRITSASANNLDVSMGYDLLLVKN